VRLPILAGDGAFNTDVPWERSRSGNPYYIHRSCLGTTVECWWDVQLRVTIKAPPKKAAPVYKDWERRFFPGGLPGLGKRRR